MRKLFCGTAAAGSLQSSHHVAAGVECVALPRLDRKTNSMVDSFVLIDSLIGWLINCFALIGHPEATPAIRLLKV